MSRNTLEHRREEARDRPADQHGGDDVQAVPKIQVYSRKNSAVEEKDRDFGRRRAGGIDGFEDIQRLAHLLCVDKADSQDVFPEAVTGG